MNLHNPSLNEYENYYLNTINRYGQTSLHENSFNSIRSSASLPRIGKSFSSKEATAPSFGFGTSQRFKEISQDILDYNYTPGPIYQSSDKFKFYKSPETKFPKDKKNSYSKEKYEYYKFRNVYNFSNMKKWDKTIGGAIQYEKRTDLSQKQNFPGPGNYSPQSSTISLKPPTYTIGIKLPSNLVPETGTKNKIGPGSYELNMYENFKLSSPKWSIPQDVRKSMANKSETKNDTYYIYTACDKQISSSHVSEPKFSFSKSDRDSHSKLHFFK